jgi:hypothetical protein
MGVMAGPSESRRQRRDPRWKARWDDGTGIVLFVKFIKQHFIKFDFIKFFVIESQHIPSKKKCIEPSANTHLYENILDASKHNNVFSSVIFPSTRHIKN